MRSKSGLYAHSPVTFPSPASPYLGPLGGQPSLVLSFSLLILSAVLLSGHSQRGAMAVPQFLGNSDSRPKSCFVFSPLFSCLIRLRFSV